MRLPLLLSAPHSGLEFPPELRPRCRLSPEEIACDGDEGAAVIYALADRVDAFVTTEIARAAVDLNRAEDDRRKDGVVKTHTCWDVPIYDGPLPESLVETLLARYYRPYHAELDARAGDHLLLAVDCHTMAAVGPPIGPDPGVARPEVCISDAHGTTCPAPRFTRLVDAFRDVFAPHTVTVNDPFTGGFITRSHAATMPWVQLELSRAPFCSDDEKRERVLEAFRKFCDAESSQT